MHLRLEPGKVSQFSDKVFIYGAGNTGRSICAQLEELGIKILGFIDQNKRGKKEYCGYPLFELNEVEESLRSSQVIVSIHNRGVNVGDVLDLLRSHGIDNIMTMIDYVNANPLDTTFRYFLSSNEIILSERENILKFYDLLSDEESKNLYQEILLFRLGHGYQLCPRPKIYDQYVPSDIRKWSKQIRLIDCGAYDGDSINNFINAGYEIDSVVAFEPDLNNYQKLVKNTRELSITCLPCGVGSSTEILRFDSGGGEGSRINEAGDALIQICSIDDTLGNWAPNFIKMDIEGAENDAIKGAQNTIKKYQPIMAISAYHTPSDLWRLGLTINEISNNYEFYIRCHAYSSFDTVLYALPKI